MNNQRKVPLRKCIVTGEMKPKKQLVRIVRSKDGEVSIDLTGRKNGRGAYLTLDKETIEKAIKKSVLSSQLKAEVNDTIYEELLILAEKEQK
ncbi:DUF448 domain-containing protein [Bacillus lacus]|uniref:DUF448 domain-containing protein n=1 Tax=Metabacillus lacus TaxID=1983721 RepID=A0A7X2IW98_9BACI|nr:YlxR family protein [Metabacillus lacus]MRX70632.1 DUF448 domain-containing protein [Metabacillus lacus]